MGVELTDIFNSAVNNSLFKNKGQLFSTIIQEKFIKII